MKRKMFKIMTTLITESKVVKFCICGKSVIMGWFPGCGFKLHYTDAERMKNFNDLVFRANPRNMDEKMAKIDFKNGYSLNVSTVHSESRVYYNVSVLLGGVICSNSGVTYGRASYCNRYVVDDIIERIQKLNCKKYR